MSASPVKASGFFPILGLISLLALPTSAVAAADDPRAWLERMSDAVEFLNYEGTLVHVHGGDSSVMRIAHRVEGGQVTERITSDDAGREIIRTDDEVTCIFPDKRTVLVEERDEANKEQSPLRVHLPASRVNEALYHVSFAGSERVAGRSTQIIAIRAKDSFRYGYRIWLDRKTAMPLKTQLVDEHGDMLEQILFSTIELPNRLPSSAVQPSVPIETFAVRRSGIRTTAPPDEQPEQWSATEIPPGFALTVRNAKVAPDAGNDGDTGHGVRHLVYSDGLATVSLFVEPAVAASEQAEGLSQIGAANAYTTTVDGHMITAIGEVPVHTVERFAKSARSLPAAPAR